MTLFGNKVIANIIIYDEVVLEHGGGSLSNMTGALVSGEKTQRHTGRMPCDNRARNYSTCLQAKKCQGLLSTAEAKKKALELSERTLLCQHPGLKLLVSRL